MYHYRDRVKIASNKLKPANTVYWYSVAVMLVLLLSIYSPVQAAINSSYVISAGITNQNNKNYLQTAVGYHIPASLSESELAMRYYNDQEFVMAYRIWLPLAEQNSVDAQFYTAMLFDMGKGVKRNARQAVYWYQRAAHGGNHHAQHNLGVAYADGEGIKRDLVKAIMWWQRSASQGNTDSQYNLGMLYAMGNKTIKRDYDKAHKWWQRAAISGDAMAQYNLGSLFANGDGVIKNYCEAVKWWQKSANNGFSQASMALQLIVEKHNINCVGKNEEVNLLLIHKSN